MRSPFFRSGYFGTIFKRMKPLCDPFIGSVIGRARPGVTMASEMTSKLIPKFAAKVGRKARVVFMISFAEGWKFGFWIPGWGSLPP
jgi:hypothetical protein